LYAGAKRLANVIAIAAFALFAMKPRKANAWT
jgi:hypothetical protein